MITALYTPYYRGQDQLSVPTLKRPIKIHCTFNSYNGSILDGHRKAKKFGLALTHRIKILHSFKPHTSKFM